MLKKLTDILQKLINVETVTYIFFGVGTTVVNLIAFKIFNIILGEGLYLVSNVIAWIIAVIFAYITNKLWVFESKSFSAAVLKKEIPAFLGARILSFFIEEGGLWLFVDILGFDRYSLGVSWLNGEQTAGQLAVGGKMLSKLIIAVIVIILNYFFSKVIIFKKDGTREQ
ncbi:MAG: GtrA family protein [Clostridia bacterium]|nr:GtrA family protein [Clostridia bacterium]